jgi:hypothetical protein
MSVVWEVLVDAVADVAVDAPALASAAQAQSCCGASPRGSVVIRDSSFSHLIRPRPQRGQDRQAEGRGAEEPQS